MFYTPTKRIYCYRIRLSELNTYSSLLIDYGVLLTKHLKPNNSIEGEVKYFPQAGMTIGKHGGFFGRPIHKFRWSNNGKAFDLTKLGLG